MSKLGGVITSEALHFNVLEKKLEGVGGRISFLGRNAGDGRLV